MPEGESDWVWESWRAQQPFVEEDDATAESEPEQKAQGGGCGLQEGALLLALSRWACLDRWHMLFQMCRGAGVASE